MRLTIIAALLLLASCAQEAAPPTQQIAPGRFAAGERDGLCIVGVGTVQRAGFIAYGPGDANCSASGTIVGAPGKWALRPAGEGDCAIPLRIGKDGVVLGTMTPSCAYYCAPGLSFAGKAFTSVKPVQGVPTDFAGDPLC
jgi:hypothetical protein